MLRSGGAPEYKSGLKYGGLGMSTTSGTNSNASSLLDEDMNIIDAMRLKGMKLLHYMCYLVYVLMASISFYTWWFDPPESNLTFMDKYRSVIFMSIVCYVIQEVTRRSHQTMMYTPLVLMSFNFVLALERDISLSPIEF